jgi:ketosteroid isomerase-like protein
MNSMRYALVLTVLLSLTASTNAAAAPAGPELTAMLRAFLAGASVNDAAAHDRFWAEELVYTSSRGLRFGKPDIMEGLESSGEPDENEPETVYSAEDIRVQQFGDTAVVAFRLLGAVQDGSGEVLEYFNTGTFVQREGEWRVVAWQATAIPEPE